LYKVVQIILLSLFLPFILPYLKSLDKKEMLSMSVAQACDFALENNRTVRSSGIDISLAEKKVSENLAFGLPQVNLSANYLHQFVVPALIFGQVLDTDELPDGPVTL